MLKRKVPANVGVRRLHRLGRPPSAPMVVSIMRLRGTAEDRAEAMSAKPQEAHGLSSTRATRSGEP
jgi:hypothetical protein